MPYVYDGITITVNGGPSFGPYSWPPTGVPTVNYSDRFQTDTYAFPPLDVSAIPADAEILSVALSVFFGDNFNSLVQNGFPADALSIAFGAITTVDGVMYNNSNNIQTYLPINGFSAGAGWGTDPSYSTIDASNVQTLAWQYDPAYRDASGNIGLDPSHPWTKARIASMQVGIVAAFGDHPGPNGTLSSTTPTIVNYKFRYSFFWRTFVPDEPPPPTGPGEPGPVTKAPPTNCCPTQNGPAGPAGPSGAQGTAGVNGRNGTGSTGGGDGGGSGGNPGGTGWGDPETGGILPEPPCDDTGGVPSWSNPRVLPTETFDNTSETQFWARLDHVNDTTTYRGFWTLRDHPIPDPPTYEGGYKRAKIKSISPITRALSNLEGDYVGSSGTIELDDSDRETRLSLVDPAIRWLMGGEMTFYRVSEARRRARGTPTVVGRAMVRGYDLGNRLSAVFSLEDPISSEYGPLGSRRTITDRVLTRGMFPYLPIQNINIPQKLILGPVGDWGAYDPATGTLQEKGIVNVTTVGERSIGGQMWTEYFVCGHAISSVDMYGANPDNTERVGLDESLYGTYALAPGHAGWPYAQTFVDILDTNTGKTHRCTLLYARGYIADSHKNSQINVAVNVCGLEETGDGTGRMVSGLFRAWQLVSDNFVFRKPGYYSGLYSTSPQWISDGTYLTDSQSFEDAQTLSQRFVGGEGYRVGMVIEGNVLTKTVMKMFAVTSNAQYFWRRSGQFSISLLDDAMDYTTTTKLITPSQVRSSTAPTYTTSAVENPVFVNFDFDFDKNRWRAEPIELRDPLAIRNTGNVERPNTIDCWASRHRSTVIDAMSRRFLRRKYPRPTVGIVLLNEGLNYELGDVVRIDGVDGEGYGWKGAPVRLESESHDPITNRTTYNGTVLVSITADSEAGSLAGTVITNGVLNPALVWGGFNWSPAVEWRS